MVFKRVHLFEFGDQPWFPLWLRREGMELLDQFFKVFRSYEPAVETLRQFDEIVVLAAGSGGGITQLAPEIRAKITLTDIFPDKDFASDRMSYEREPVDATNVPERLKGARVMFTAFHHFKPPQARKILEDAVKAREPIAIFEVTERSAKGFAMIAILPLVALAVTPFTKPVTWTRLLSTYIVPAVPFFILWDGFVSTLRTYELDEMRELTKDLTTYDWQIEKRRGPWFVTVTSYVGKPKPS